MSNPNNTAINQRAQMLARTAPKDILTLRAHEEAGSRILEIQAQLSQLDPETMPRLPERIFVDYFLPLFAGEVEVPEDKRERITKWMEVAGNPFKEVRIIADDDHNTTLFQVPPLFDRSVIRPHVEGRHTLGHIMRSADQYSQISPQAGRNYLGQQFMRFEIFKDIEEHRMEFAERWNAILQRYGKPPITSATAAGEAGAASETPVDDDPFVF